MKNLLKPEQQQSLLNTLEARFKKHPGRHVDIEWPDVRQKLESSPTQLWSLNEMEQSGGEPDVVGFEPLTGAYVFYDCSPESPKGRRSVCYDQEALQSRKDFPPQNSAVGLAAAMGVELLDEEKYRHLQTFGKFDTKTSSWLKTPADIRKLEGAIFGDFRYGHVFIYHNGAQSYYAARGFRTVLYV